METRKLGIIEIPKKLGLESKEYKEVCHWFQPISITEDYFRGIYSIVGISEMFNDCDRFSEPPIYRPIFDQEGFTHFEAYTETVDDTISKLQKEIEKLKNEIANSLMIPKEKLISSHTFERDITYVVKREK